MRNSIGADKGSRRLRPPTVAAAAAKARAPPWDFQVQEYTGWIRSAHPGNARTYRQEADVVATLQMGVGMGDVPRKIENIDSFFFLINRCLSLINFFVNFFLSTSIK